MIKYITPLAFVLLSATGVASANVAKTAGQAVSDCKTHIKENVPGATSAKMSRLRTVRDRHLITFAVRDENGRHKTVCSVNRADGSIALNK